jgi:biopolymer transport protein ExbD
MITRPLDLASKLRPEPRNFDYVFFVNGGLLVLFFLLFASRFVLAPALGVDFKLPEMPNARLSAAEATHFISVKRGGQIIAGAGLLNKLQLREWLRVEAKTVSEPVLLVRAHAEVPVSELTEISTAAREAGFVRVQLAVEEAGASAGYDQ